MPATIYHPMPESVGDKKGAVTKAANEGAAGGDHDLQCTADLHLVLSHDSTYAGKRIADLTLEQFMRLPGAQSVYGALDEAKAAKQLYVPCFEVKPGDGTHKPLPYQRLKDYADKIGQPFALMTLRRYPYDNSQRAKAWEASAVLRIKAMRSVGLPCGVLWHPTTGPGSIIADPSDPLLLVMAWVKAPPRDQKFRDGVDVVPQNSATYDIALAHLMKVAYTPEVPPVPTAPTPVTQKRIDTAKAFGLTNVEQAAVACRLAGLPFYAACALLEKESGGRNVYGHDKGGVLSGFPDDVSPGNFAAFRYEVVVRGQTSNGVGPCQLTYKGFFTDMESKGLRPYAVADNMLYGFGLLAGYYKAHGNDWAAAGTAYNGASAYGVDLAKKVGEWRARLGIK